MTSAYPPGEGCPSCGQHVDNCECGMCQVCGRDERPDGTCPCCKKCGDHCTPCACEFDLSTPQGQRDYEKYGNAFIGIDTETAYVERSLAALPPLPYKPTCEKCNRIIGEDSCQHCGHTVGRDCDCCDRCGPKFSIQMQRYLAFNVRPPGTSVVYVDAVDSHPNPPVVAMVRVVFCHCRLPVVTPIDKATSFEKCVLRAGHDGEHQLQDGRRWENAPCIARCAVKNEVYTPVQCDLPAGHEGDHTAFRGDGVGESLHWTWPDSLSIATWVPRAYVPPKKKRSLLSIVREFFTRRRHIRPPEGGPKTGGGS